MKFNIKDFKMHLLKQTINYVTPRIIDLTRGVKASTPQSRIIERVWSRLENVYKKEVASGVFTDSNFLNLLLSAKDTLIFLCEKDRYYKRWLGLLLLFIMEEMQRSFSDFSYIDALNMTSRPLLLKKSEFEKHKTALFNFEIASYLYSLTLIRNKDINLIREARRLNTMLDLPTNDKNVLVRFYFPKDKYAYFQLMFRDRFEQPFKENLPMET